MQSNVQHEWLDWVVKIGSIVSGLAALVLFAEGLRRALREERRKRSGQRNRGE